MAFFYFVHGKEEVSRKSNGVLSYDTIEYRRRRRYLASFVGIFYVHISEIDVSPIR